jgi:hypothetical protein
MFSTALEAMKWFRQQGYSPSARLTFTACAR